MCGCQVSYKTTSGRSSLLFVFVVVVLFDFNLCWCPFELSQNPVMKPLLKRRIAVLINIPFGCSTSASVISVSGLTFPAKATLKLQLLLTISN